MRLRVGIHLLLRPTGNLGGVMQPLLVFFDAAELVFLPAAAGTRLIAANLGHRPAHGRTTRDFPARRLKHPVKDPPPADAQNSLAVLFCRRTRRTVFFMRSE